MPIIKQEDINTIRSNTDIVEVISNYLPLSQKGKNYFGVCPFHDDHSPSMSVSQEKQIYTCFSCGATGNVFNFVMDFENIDFISAVKLLSVKAGVNLDIANIKPNKPTSILYEIYDVSFKYFQNNLNSKLGVSALDYLTKRDINSNLIKEFGIGLALDENNSLTNLLSKREYRYDDLLKSGLVNLNENSYHDVYYKRIMFPLWDLTGKVVGYSGRIYNNEDTSKYINTKETEIFKKGELLYNYHRAKDAARQSQTIIVMEGFMDVIRAYTIGVTNVVATMGTAVTKEQATLIKKMAKNVILCFDGDSAGAKATYAASNELINIGLMPSVIRLEDDMDPDDYIKKYGKDKFLNRIDNKMDVMDFKLSYLKNNLDINNSVELSSYVDQVLKETSLINNDILREITIQKLSEESHLDIEFLRNKLTTKEISKSAVSEVNLRYDKYQKAERNILYYMLHSKEIVKIFMNNSLYLPNKEYRELAIKIVNYYDQYKDVNIADIMSYLGDNPVKLRLIGEIEALNLKFPYKVDEIEDYINAINEYNQKYSIDILQTKMKNAGTTEEKTKILKEIMDIKLRREE